MFSQLWCIAGTAKRIKRKGRIILIDVSMHAAEKGCSLDAQILEQQGRKREA